MLGFRRIRWIEQQVLWLTERFYRRERETENRYEQRICHLERRVDLAERLIEFLKVSGRPDVPSPARFETDLPIEMEPDPLGHEDDLDEGLTSDDVAGDMFPTPTFVFNQEGGYDGELTGEDDAANAV